MSEKLTAQQELFCHEYLVDLNATEAAKRAGYSKKTARTQGSRLLTNVAIMTRIQELLAPKIEKIEITAEKVIQELGRIAFAKMTDVARWTHSGMEFIPSRDLTEDQAATILMVSESTNQHGGSLRIQQHDKLKALELLGKHLKLYTDKVEHSGNLTLEDLVAGSMKKEGSE